ncbi:hypothetical protein M2T82_02690 [Elizabethkingia ursingii]|uniref:hypothetical protein n=1 Tax=Elizabethkingia ursingii TaxID=1756150 RepID=UPI002012D253|nr:hypothetical protein [Elizabethkingia ursingii]MCL1666963.1 hypothetical protein [Elizabethkingia ursingii]
MKRILLGLVILNLSSCGKEKKTDNSIVLENKIDKSFSSKTDEYLMTNKFEVVSNETRLNNLKNISVLLKSSKKSKKDIEDIIKEIRIYYIPYRININIFDDINALKKADIYPLEGNDKKFVAKHFIAMSSFDAPEVIWMYPNK